MWHRIAPELARHFAQLHPTAFPLPAVEDPLGHAQLATDLVDLGARLHKLESAAMNLLFPEPGFSS